MSWSEPISRGALGRIRTCDARFRKPTLYPLSYEGRGGMVPTGTWPPAGQSAMPAMIASFVKAANLAVSKATTSWASVSMITRWGESRNLANAWR